MEVKAMAIKLREQPGIMRLAYAHMAVLLRRHVSVLAPAILSTVALALLATVVYYFPRDPINKFFYGPVSKLPYFTTLAIREGLGHPSQFFRYPNNFIIVRVLFRWGDAAFSSTAGIVLVATMVRMVMRAMEGVETAFGSSLWLAIRRWPGLVVLWAIPYAIVWGANQWINGLIKRGIAANDFTAVVYGVPLLRFVWLTLAFILAVVVLVQTLTLYALPSIIVEGRRVWWALGRGFSLLREMWLPSLGIVSVAVLVLLPGGLLATFYRYMPALRDVPDVSFYSICVDVAAGFFFNVLLYVPATILFVLKRDTEGQEVG